MCDKEGSVMPENITVTDGDVTEVCDIQETYTYYGDTVAKVDGDTINGFVQIE
jgi:hypothetical protein